ncbi:MAG: hypothetical protein ACFFB8_06005 [Promethearchaeota archaeon]
MIVSESSFRRNILSEMHSTQKKIKVIDTARNDQETIKIIETKRPDVLILDFVYENKKWLTSFNGILKELNYQIVDELIKFVS